MAAPLPPAAERPSSVAVSRFRTEVPADFQCLICTSVPLQPRMGPCEHICCDVCITEWLGRNQSCPGCRESLRPAALRPPGRLVQNLMARLEAQCDYAERGCDEYVPLERYLAHMDECGKAPAACPHASCGAAVNREDLEEHERECGHRSVACPLCGLGTTARDLAAHQGTECSHVAVECQCGATVTRGDQQEHLAERCPEATIGCPLEACGLRLKRRDVAAHLQGAAADHLVMVAGALCGTQRVVGELRSRLQELEEENAQLRSAAQQAQEKADERHALLRQENDDLRRSLQELRVAVDYLREWRCVSDRKWVWTIGNIHAKLDQAKFSAQGGNYVSVDSPPCHTSPGGYRYFLTVYLYGKNKETEGHVGVFFRLLPGENDDHLQWPFSMKITVTVGSEVGCLDPSQSVGFAQWARNIGRPTSTSEDSTGSWGWPKFDTYYAFVDSIKDNAAQVFVRFETPWH